MLLIMGLGTQMVAWDDEFCRLLAAEHLRVIRFDNRDIGLSSHLTALGVPDLEAAAEGKSFEPPYRLADMAGDVVGLLDALGLQAAHVVGASMGGMIAQELVIAHPSRVLSLTSIMSTPAPEIGVPTEAAMAALFTPPGTDLPSAVARAIKVQRVIGSPGYPLDEEALAARVKVAWERSEGDAEGVVRQMVCIMGSPDRRPGLSRTTVPTLVLHGEDDPLVTLEGGEATAEVVPGARLVVFAGMGHNLPVQLWPSIIAEISDHVRGVVV
ncbi:alpha/beta fold hydrolase [Nocardioides albidus]|uniref:alpha/beta fold hydrolase n=1 Tax=Nocardioides albidus TaxID=1517589 RepID=UPI00196115A5|nr:alpha/beta fold hydrolase [Nocardioides albidus]